MPKAITGALHNLPIARNSTTGPKPKGIQTCPHCSASHRYAGRFCGEKCRRAWLDGEPAIDVEFTYPDTKLEKRFR